MEILSTPNQVFVSIGLSSSIGFLLGPQSLPVFIMSTKTVLCGRIETLNPDRCVHSKTGKLVTKNQDYCIPSSSGIRSCVGEKRKYPPDSLTLLSADKKTQTPSRSSHKHPEETDKLLSADISKVSRYEPKKHLLKTLFQT